MSAVVSGPVAEFDAHPGMMPASGRADQRSRRRRLGVAGCHLLDAGSAGPSPERRDGPRREEGVWYNLINAEQRP